MLRITSFLPAVALSTGLLLWPGGAALPLPPPPLDIIFAIDESTSMTPAQNGVKQQINNMFNQLAALVPSFRVGLVGFGQKSNIGNPRVRHVLTANKTSFKAAVNSLKANGGREPGYMAAQQIAANNVDGLALNTDPNYPGPHPGSDGYCVVLISDEDSDGVETFDDTVAALTSTGGIFFSVTNNQPDYVSLAAATGGFSRSLNNFVIDSRPILRNILATCVKQIQCNQTTYHIYDSDTDQEVEALYDGWVGCIKEPYNIELRLCDLPQTTPILFKLWCANGYIIRNKEYVQPFMFFGDDTKGDVFANTKPLPDETYRLYSTVDGIQTYITFTQKCAEET